jgi:hypothetical protein
MTDRWQICTELDWYGDPAYDKTIPLWVVYDAGEDDPPLCTCDSEPEARTVADALNTIERVRDVPRRRMLTVDPSRLPPHAYEEVLAVRASDLDAALDGET